MKELFEMYYKNKILKENIKINSALESIFKVRYSSLTDRNSTNEDSICNTGTCVPGKRKIYVSCDGNFHVCEKINNQFPIGNCFSGINYKNVKELYSNYFYTSTLECSDCIAKHNCTICFASAACGNIFNFSNICDQVRKNFKYNLTKYMSILEKNNSSFN